MSDRPSNNSMIPPDMKPPSELKDPQPDPSDVVPDGGCKPLAPDTPVRPGSVFKPPPPKPPVIA